MAKEIVVGDRGIAVLLLRERSMKEEEAFGLDGPTVCTWGMGIEYDEEGEEYRRRCLCELAEVGVRREPGEPFPYPETGLPDHDEDHAGKPAVKVKRQLVCPKHGVVDSINSVLLVEDLAALEPLWVET